MSLELMNAKNLILINDAASKELKKESDGKISSMEIALSEAKSDNQISNNASVLKSNEAENSKTTQTEPISANEENSEEINTYPITWKEFKDGLNIYIGKMLFANYLHVEENVKDGLNVYMWRLQLERGT